MEKKAYLDPKLPNIIDDPRLLDRRHQGKAQKQRGAGRNTESFDPNSTLVRPSMRILIGTDKCSYGKKLKNDDVIITPEFICKEDDWSLYYKLIDEMRDIQKTQEGKKAEWISWHEGAHLISKDPSASPSFQMIVKKMADYFNIKMESVGTRFNWYTNSSDWKPFHHDSAAFNPERAKNQNITVGLSLGSTRELAFLNAKTGEKIYFPQDNGMLFSFGRDVNINWKHGVNALPKEEQDGKGRISIILWGLAPNVIEEDDSPPMLNDNTRGNGYSMHSKDRTYESSKNHNYYDKKRERQYNDNDYYERKYYKRRSRSRDDYKSRNYGRDDYRNDKYYSKN